MRQIIDWNIKRIAALLLCGVFCIVFARVSEIALKNPTEGITPDVLRHVEEKYNTLTMNRLKDWMVMINDSQALSEEAKLRTVNDFFNDRERFNYTPDKLIWGRYDYWATPVEFILKGAGDCEDYAIAKFFTLLALNVSQEKLKLSYVYLKEKRPYVNNDQAHMVLSYYDAPESIPMILDNADPLLKSAADRPDLKPVLTFNGLGLWEEKQREEGIRSPGDIKPWAEMNERTLESLGVT